MEAASARLDDRPSLLARRLLYWRRRHPAQVVVGKLSSRLRCRATAGDVKEIFRRPDSFLFLSNAAWRAENPGPVGDFSLLTGRMSREAGSEIMNHSLTGAAMIRIVVAFATVSAVILIIGGVVGYLMPRF